MASILKSPGADDAGEAEGLPLERLRECFHLSARDACARLHISQSKLKKLCRQYGISRWPHRKLASLAALRTQLQNDSGISCEERQALLTRLEQQVAAILQDPDRPIEQQFEDMRQSIYKVRYQQKAVRRRQLSGGSATPSEQEGQADEEEEDEEGGVELGAQVVEHVATETAAVVRRKTPTASATAAAAVGATTTARHVGAVAVVSRGSHSGCPPPPPPRPHKQQPQEPQQQQQQQLPLPPLQHHQMPHARTRRAPVTSAYTGGSAAAGIGTASTIAVAAVTQLPATASAAEAAADLTADSLSCRLLTPGSVAAGPGIGALHESSWCDGGDSKRARTEHPQQQLRVKEVPPQEEEELQQTMRERFPPTAAVEAAPAPSPSRHPFGPQQAPSKEPLLQQGGTYHTSSSNAAEAGTMAATGTRAAEVKAATGGMPARARNQSLGSGSMSVSSGGGGGGGGGGDLCPEGDWHSHHRRRLRSSGTGDICSGGDVQHTGGSGVTTVGGVCTTLAMQAGAAAAGGVAWGLAKADGGVKMAVGGGGGGPRGVEGLWTAPAPAPAEAAAAAAAINLTRASEATCSPTFAVYPQQTAPQQRQQLQNYPGLELTAADTGRRHQQQRQEQEQEQQVHWQQQQQQRDADFLPQQQPLSDNYPQYRRQSANIQPPPPPPPQQQPPQQPQPDPQQQPQQQAEHLQHQQPPQQQHDQQRQYQCGQQQQLEAQFLWLQGQRQGAEPRWEKVTTLSYFRSSGGVGSQPDSQLATSPTSSLPDSRVNWAGAASHAGPLHPPAPQQQPQSQRPQLSLLRLQPQPQQLLQQLPCEGYLDPSPQEPLSPQTLMSLQGNDPNEQQRALTVRKRLLQQMDHSQQQQQMLYGHLSVRERTLVALGAGKPSPSPLRPSASPIGLKSAAVATQSAPEATAAPSSLMLLPYSNSTAGPMQGIAVGTAASVGTAIASAVPSLVSAVGGWSGRIGCEVNSGVPAVGCGGYANSEQQGTSPGLQGFSSGGGFVRGGSGIHVTLAGVSGTAVYGGMMSVGSSCSGSSSSSNQCYGSSASGAAAAAMWAPAAARAVAGATGGVMGATAAAAGAGGGGQLKYQQQQRHLPHHMMTPISGDAATATSAVAGFAGGTCTAPGYEEAAAASWGCRNLVSALPSGVAGLMHAGISSSSTWQEGGGPRQPSPFSPLLDHVTPTTGGGAAQRRLSPSSTPININSNNNNVITTGDGGTSAAAAAAAAANRAAAAARLMPPPAPMRRQPPPPPPPPFQQQHQQNLAPLARQPYLSLASFPLNAPTANLSGSNLLTTGRTDHAGGPGGHCTTAWGFRCSYDGSNPPLSSSPSVHAVLSNASAADAGWISTMPSYFVANAVVTSAVNGGAVLAATSSAAAAAALTSTGAASGVASASMSDEEGWLQEQQLGAWGS